MSETKSCSRRAYEGEVEQWAEEEVEKELAVMTGSLERLCSMSETGSCSRWAYEGKVEQWAEEEGESGDDWIA